MSSDAAVENDRRWWNMIQQDMKLLQLMKEDTGDRNRWRRRIRVANPLPWEGLIQAWRRYNIYINVSLNHNSCKHDLGVALLRFVSGVSISGKPLPYTYSMCMYVFILHVRTYASIYVWILHNLYYKEAIIDTGRLKRFHESDKHGQWMYEMNVWSMIMRLNDFRHLEMQGRSQEGILD